jgi:hypothetical protein
MGSAGNESVTVNWRPTLDDAYFSLRLGFWGTPGRAIRSMVLLFVFPTAVFGWVLNIVMGSQMSAAGIIGVALACGLGWAVFFSFAFGAWLARFVVKTQRAKGDPQKIVLGPDTVERILKDSKITHPWSAISSIEETRPVFILLGSSGPLTSIEKSGISSNAELQTLRAFLRAKKPGKYFNDEST